MATGHVISSNESRSWSSTSSTYFFIIYIKTCHTILCDRFKPWAWNRRDADSWKGLPGPMSLNVGPRQLSVARSLMSGQRELQKPSWHPSCISSLGDGLWISPVIPENRALKTWRLPKIEVPPNHPFIDGFWIINHPAIGGTPMASLWLWKPHGT